MNNNNNPFNNINRTSSPWLQPHPGFNPTLPWNMFNANMQIAGPRTTLFQQSTFAPHTLVPDSRPVHFNQSALRLQQPILQLPVQLVPPPVQTQSQEPDWNQYPPGEEDDDMSSSFVLDTEGDESYNDRFSANMEAETPYYSSPQHRQSSLLRPDAPEWTPTGPNTFSFQSMSSSSQSGALNPQFQSQLGSSFANAAAMYAQGRPACFPSVTNELSQPAESTAPQSRNPDGVGPMAKALQQKLATESDQVNITPRPLKRKLEPSAKEAFRNGVRALNEPVYSERVGIGFTTALGAETSTGASSVEEEKPGGICQSMFRRSCFNCDGSHGLSDCTSPRNWQKINMRRREFQSLSQDAKNCRYHEGENEANSEVEPKHLQPGGELSPTLRHALGLTSTDIPRHVYNMRRLGYPPMYREQLLDKLMIWRRAQRKKRSEDGHMFFSANQEPTVDSIYRYPGFNAPAPPGYRPKGMWQQVSDSTHSYEETNRQHFFDEINRQVDEELSAESEELSEEEDSARILTVSDTDLLVHLSHRERTSQTECGSQTDKSLSVEEQIAKHIRRISTEQDRELGLADQSPDTGSKIAGTDSTDRLLKTGKLTEKTVKIITNAEASPTSSFEEEEADNEGVRVVVPASSGQREKLLRLSDNLLKRLEKTVTRLEAVGDSSGCPYVEQLSQSLTPTEQSTPNTSTSTALPAIPCRIANIRRRSPSPSLIGTDFEPSSPPSEETRPDIPTISICSNSPMGQLTDSEEVEEIPREKTDPVVITLDENSAPEKTECNDSDEFEILDDSQIDPAWPYTTTTKQDTKSSDKNNSNTGNTDGYLDQNNPMDADIHETDRSRGVFRDVFYNSARNLPQINSFTTGVEHELLLVPEAQSPGTYNRVSSLLATRRRSARGSDGPNKQ